MDRERLIEGYRSIVRTIYSPRSYYQRVCQFLDRYQPRRQRKMSLAEIRAFFRSMVFVGLWGNGASQWYYWKMLVKSMIVYRPCFAEAMTLMVYGHHFRKIAKRI